ncbi:DNA binding methylated-DNA-cysteine S-methyltransferase, partial [Gloeophyllum trabeum ATCC 11539]
YRTPSGKKVTSHQWAVYDYILQIPEGKVTTYKQICLAIGQGSPRTVGSALRNNPFAPYVPCHRVIASSLFIGGFFGEWGTIRRINQPAGRPVVLDKSEFQCERKLELLRKEGVCFTSDGYLEDKLGSLWK